MYYLAIDIGASSGRHILAKVENGKIELKEIYRFSNGVTNLNGKLTWNTDKLFENILCGLKECNKLGIVPYSVGIDTWGVDYALLDKNGNIIDEVYAYRDGRTEGVPEETEKIMPFSKLYEITGIQKNVFNTVYQLYLDKKSGKLDKADKFLMIPDLLNYYLTGKMVNEYTDASTTALLNAETRTWDDTVLNAFGFDKKIFCDIVEPGSVIGNFSDKIAKEVGFNTLVVSPATHDTGSAVMAIPSNAEIPLYLSSGTWSLLGTELKSPNTTKMAENFNFTNEGGFNHTIRFLRNITGMWTTQCIKKELNDKYSFVELSEMAKKCDESISTVVNLNDDSFLSPPSMIEAVKDYARKTNQQVPESVGEIICVVLKSLAFLYAKTIKQTEEILGVKFTSLNIVGGGSQNKFLNELTKRMTGLKVFAGPTEGTAIGNVICQAISSKQIKNIFDARKAVIESFDVVEI